MDEPASRASSPVLGVLLIIGGICTVQVGAAIGKGLFDQISPAGLTFLRLGFAAAVLLIIARPRLRGWTRRMWLPVIGFGVVLGMMNLLYYLSLELIPQAVAVTCELLGPLVLAAVLSRRVADGAWVAIAAVGVLLIGVSSLSGNLNLIGVLLALGAGVCWALYILFSQRVGSEVSGLSGLAVAMAVGAVVVAPFGLVPAAESIAFDSAILLPALGIALLSSVLPYALELWALRRVEARVFGVLMSLEPAAAALFAFLLLGELVGVIDGAAIALVILASAGVAITAARGRQRGDGLEPQS